MNQPTINQFTEKVMSKTISHDLRWITIKDKEEISSLPEEDLVCFCPKKHYDLVYSYSYSAKYKTGKIILLTYCDISILPISPPPEKSFFSLRVQDTYRRFCTEITNSGRDPVDHEQLIRLYNLIDDELSSATTLINDFLNS